MIRTERNCPRREGFTLVELLVVIAIIAVLASMVILGVFAMIGNRTKSNTEANVRVLHKMLQTRWAAVIADAKKETPSLEAMKLAGYNPALPPGVFYDPERARVIWIKVRLCEAFPLAFKELNPADATTIVNVYIPPNKLKPHFTKYRTTITAYPAVPGATESAACLLMAFRNLPGEGTSIEDQMKNSVGDSDGDGIPELVDGWGRPLAFFRFPYKNLVLQAANPAAVNSAAANFADPTDPTGKLLERNQATSWYKSANRGVFETDFKYEILFKTIPGPSPQYFAYYTTPVIASMGKDGVLDLNPDFSSASTKSLDNILSFQLRGD